MNPFNKYETVGIFVSIAIMAITLSIIRFKGEMLVASVDPEKQVALVSTDEEDTMKDDDELESALKDSFSSKGELRELVIDDVRLGSGAAVKNGDILTVHYIGTTQEGVRFDSSYERGTPFTFKIGQGIVIQGWEKGLIGMKVGGQRILVIPGSMAYGNMQVGVIPPNAALVFAVELLKIE